jgi:hypothetical protein
MQTETVENKTSAQTETAEAGLVQRGVSRRWKILLRGCDDSTMFEMELSDDEANTLRKVSKTSKATSTCDCMPTIEIEAANLGAERQSRAEETPN